MGVEMHLGGVGRPLKFLRVNCILEMQVRYGWKIRIFKREIIAEKYE
jgi:hypothetical protein